MITDVMVLEATAQCLAGPMAAFYASRAHVGTPGDPMIPYRRQAGDVLSLLRELGIYNSNRVITATEPTVVTDDVTIGEIDGPWPYVDLVLYWGSASCRQRLDPATFVIADCRRYALEKLTSKLIEHRRARGEPLPGTPE